MGGETSADRASPKRSAERRTDIRRGPQHEPSARAISGRGYDQSPVGALVDRLGNRGALRALRSTRSSSPAGRSSAAAPAVQRKRALGCHDGTCDGECETCARTGAVQRAVQGKAAAGDAPAAVHAAANAGVASASEPLPHLARVQAAFGRHDVTFARAQVGGPAEEASVAIGAQAYTVGDRVGFRAEPDLRLAAHEAAHLVQQRDGVTLAGGVGTAGDRYEQHADQVADAVARGHSAEALLDGHANTPGVGGVQRQEAAEAERSEVAAEATATAAPTASASASASATATATATATGDSSDDGGGTGSGPLDSLVSGIETGVSALGGAASWIASAAGKLALRGANAIAEKFGGSVTLSPAGGIDIHIGDVNLADVMTETETLPLGLPTETLVEAGTEVGPFVIEGWVGTTYGDPTVTIGLGPFTLTNILLHLDPGASTYSGTATVSIGSAISGSLEEAHEARVLAVGAIGEVPVVASADGGVRKAVRVDGKENVRHGVTVSYTGGTFSILDSIDVQIGTVGEVDHEAFLRIEIETEEVCSLIWPLSTHTLWDKGGEVRMKLGFSSGPGGSASISSLHTSPISARAIVTTLENEHEPSRCMDIKDIAALLCKKGLAPPAVCGVVAPPGPTVGPHGVPGPTPLPVGPTPPGPTPPGPTPPGPTPPGPTPPGPPPPVPAADACVTRFRLAPGKNARWQEQRAPISGQTTVSAAAFRLDAGIPAPPGQDTTPGSRTWARSIGQPTDDAGHVIGKRFGGDATFNGPGGNIFPQNLSKNRGMMRDADKRAALRHDSGCDVCVHLALVYASNSALRPESVLYTLLVRPPGAANFDPPVVLPAIPNP